MAALLEAYITNLGRYAEDGVEAGATLKFPATTEELQSLLKRIGVDGVRYEEIFIHGRTSKEGSMQQPEGLRFFTIAGQGCDPAAFSASTNIIQAFRCDLIHFKGQPVDHSQVQYAIFLYCVHHRLEVRAILWFGKYKFFRRRIME